MLAITGTPPVDRLPAKSFSIFQAAFLWGSDQVNLLIFKDNYSKNDRFQLLWADFQK